MYIKIFMTMCLLLFIKAENIKQDVDDIIGQMEHCLRYCINDVLEQRKHFRS